MTSGTKGLVIYKGKLLLILRDNKPDIPFPGTWEYIGGGKDENETFAEAGLREIGEELGVRPRSYTFLGTDNYPTRQAGRFIAILSRDEYQKIRLGSEGQKYGFFTLDEALGSNMAPSLKKFLLDNKTTLRGIIEHGRPIDPDRFVFTNSPTR